MDNILSRSELNDFMMMSEGKHLDDITFDWMLNNFDCYSINNITGLTVDGFLSLYQYMVDSCDGDEKLISKDIFFMGYNKSLDLVNSSTYVIAIYYEKNVHLSLTKQNFDVDAFKLAIQLPILKYGDKEELGENSGVFFYSYKAKCGWGASFLVNNTSNTNYVLTMDCTGSINTLSYSLKTKRSTSITQKSRKVIQHFIPAEHALWSLTYQNKWEKTKFGL